MSNTTVSNTTASGSTVSGPTVSGSTVSDTATATATAGSTVGGAGRSAPATGSAFAAFAEPGRSGPDFDRIRALINELVPFSAHLGIEVTEIDARHATVEIPDRAELTNQMGTVHAGAQFTAADIAGACAFIGATASRIGEVAWLVVRDSWSSFRRPARGLVRAVASVEEQGVRRVLAAGPGERIELDGKAVLHDATGAQVGVFRFAYVADMLAAGAADGSVS
ncbi:exported hypothetical protein [Frankia sp. AiPs1]|uniref:PaaI family thioesterase n=1 Tax=Frankia sp. AiPa1 TaxID=573492 RepID=UPI00202B9712|nr:PaaI family thioesterase [Frankia sp. AiPa1]MCL9758695.1 PaaI family thioesterase [Frankia sp. AiPa1]